jgi:ribosomal protein S13
MHSAEHRSKHHVRATEDDIHSESKNSTDRSGISEMKAPSLDKVTHLLKTAEETVNLSSASRHVAHGKITHKLRVRYSKAIIRTMRGGCSHGIRHLLA